MTKELTFSAPSYFPHALLTIVPPLIRARSGGIQGITRLDDIFCPSGTWDTCALSNVAFSWELRKDLAPPVLVIDCHYYDIELTLGTLRTLQKKSGVFTQLSALLDLIPRNRCRQHFFEVSKLENQTNRLTLLSFVFSFYSHTA